MKVLLILLCTTGFAAELPDPEKLLAVPAWVMKKAPCKSRVAPVIELNDVEGIPVQATVNSVNLHDSPAHIRMFKNLTTKHTVLGIPLGEPLNLQKIYEINPECETVRCAMKKIWGEAYAEKLVHLYLHYNLNASELSFTGAQRFTDEEWTDIFIALEDLPAALVKAIPVNKQFSRIPRDTYDDEVLGNASIQLFDTWSKQRSEYRQYTIFHEISHNLGVKKKFDTSEEWLALSGWKYDKEAWKQNKCKVSLYGATHPAEDFAETATKFRYQGQDLKERCPKKYELMKEMLGIEYLTGTCQK